jgi:hypothetical protein
MAGPPNYAGELSTEVEKHTRLGQEQASEHLPPSDAARPDVNEIGLKAKAETWVANQNRLYDSALVEAAKGITELQQKTIALRTSIEQLQIEQLQYEAPLETTIESKLDAERITLTRAIEQRLRAEAGLRYFRASNQI